MAQQNAAETENSQQEKSKSQSFDKAFAMSRKYFAIAGITVNLAERSCPLNRKILMGFLMLGSGIYSSIAFITRDAETFAEYTQSIYMGSLLTFISFAVLILLSRVTEVFDAINGCDNLVHTSKL